MQRLFVAIELPFIIRRLLKEMQEGLPPMRWTPLDNLHLTIRFIGEVSHEQATVIKESLRVIRAEIFSLQVKGVGFFDKGPQAILWAGIEPSSHLLQLKRQVDDILETQVGIKNTDDFFSPHITLGRMRPVDPELLQLVTTKNNTVTTAEFAVRAFTLFKSVLIPSGAVHTIENRYPIDMT